MPGLGGAIVGQFAVRLGLDTSDYARGASNLDAANRLVGQSVTSFIVNPLLGAANLLKDFAGAVVDASGKVLSSAEAVQRLSEQTGASAELLQALSSRFELAGFGAEKASQGIRFFLKTLGQANEGGSQRDIFEAYGLTPERFSSTDQALAQTLEAINRLPDASLRAAAAAKLFGDEAGPALINAVGGGSAALRQMIESQRELGRVLDGQTIRTLADFNTTVGKAEQALGGFRDVALANFLAGFAEQFNNGGASVEDFTRSLVQDAGPAFKEFGRQVGEVLPDIREFISLLGDSARYLRDVQDRIEFLGEALNLAKTVPTAFRIYNIDQEYRRQFGNNPTPRTFED